MAATETLPSGTTQGAGVQTQLPPPVPASGNEIILTPPAQGQNVVIAVTPGEQIVVDFDLGDAILKATRTDLVIDLGNGTTITLQDFRTFAGGDQPPTVILADGTAVAGEDLIFSLGSDSVEPAAGPEVQGSGVGVYRDDMGDLLAGLGRLGPQDPGAIPTAASERPEAEGILPAVAAAVGPPTGPTGPTGPTTEPAVPPAEPLGPPTEPPGPPVEPPGPPVEPPGPPLIENSPPLAVADTVSLRIAEAVAVNTTGPNAGLYLVDLSEGGNGYQFLFNVGRPLDDITHDSEGTLWGVGRSIDRLDLFTIDMATQQVTTVATIDGIATGQVNGLVFVGGALFALSGDTLYTIDTATGEAAVFLADLGFQASTDLVEQGGNLYFVSTSGHLIEIAPAGTVNDLGALGLNPGPYGIVPGTANGDDILYLVSNKEVLVYDLADTSKNHTFDLEIPVGEGQFRGLAGDLSFPDGGLLTGDVLANDSDPDLDALSVTRVADADEGFDIAAGGSALIHGELGDLTLHSDGTWAFQLTSQKAGTDVFTYTLGDGSGNTDTATLTFSVNGIFEQNLILGSDAGETLTGMAGDDLILGHEGSDTLIGLEGDDFLFGDAGNDLLSGGTGSDRLGGGEGNDLLSGGDGGDVFVLRVAEQGGHDTIADFNVSEDILKLTDVLDTDGVAGVSAADVDVAVIVSGNDVMLALNAGGPQPQQATVTLEGINSGGAFTEDTTLQQLISHGLNVEVGEDPS